MTYRFISYDLEIAAVFPEGETVFDKRPLGITCAAAAWPTDDGTVMTDVWHGWQRNEGDFFETPAPRMTKDECAGMVKALMAAVQNGYTLLGWNSAGFDFDILAEESGMREECVELAMNHVDPMLHLFCLKGFPLGLDSAAKGLGLDGKMEGVTGAKAPELWAAGEYDKVLAYVQQDARTTLHVALAIEKQQCLTWVSKSGRWNSVDMPRLLTVREALRLPEPDVAWMSQEPAKVRDDGFQ